LALLQLAGDQFFHQFVQKNAADPPALQSGRGAEWSLFGGFRRKMFSHHVRIAIARRDPSDRSDTRPPGEGGRRDRYVEGVSSLD
jgi:hypothetical protein